MIKMVIHTMFPDTDVRIPAKHLFQGAFQSSGILTPGLPFFGALLKANPWFEIAREGIGIAKLIPPGLETTFFAWRPLTRSSTFETTSATTHHGCWEMH